MKTLLTGIAFVLCLALGLRAQAPTITAQTPLPNATAADAASSIQITWSSTMNISTINHTSVLVRGSMTPTYVTAGTAFAFSTSGNAVTITPDIPFKPNEIITVQVTTAVADANGTPMAGSQTWSFRAETPFKEAQQWTNYTNWVGNYEGLAVGDFNNDGWIDFAVSNRIPSARIEVYINNTNRTFTLSTEQTISSEVFDITVADVNSDGNLDIVAGANSQQEIFVMLGQGNGEFASTITTSANSGNTSIAAADFTGDGIIDILTSEWQGIGNSSLYIGNNTGSFSFYSTLTTVNIRDAAIGDFDGDGDLDAIAGLDADVHLNDGIGNFTRFAGPGGSDMANIEAADIDGDGDADIVAGTIFNDPASRYLAIGKNNGSAVFTISTAPTASVTEGAKSANLFDYDGDGDLDIISLYSSGILTLLLNDGFGNFSVERSVNDVPSIKRAKLLDVDLDGDLDLLTTHGGNGMRLRLARRIPELSFIVTSATTPIAAVGEPITTSATLTFAGLTSDLDVYSTSPQLTFSTNNTTFATSINFTNNSSVTTSQTIYIRYTPTTTAAFSGVATATDGSISTTLSIFGSAYLFAFSPRTLMMPTTELTTTATTSLSLSTVGLELPVQLSVTGSAFAVSTNGTVFSSSATLPATSTNAAVYVRFSPDNFGTFTGTLSAVSGIYSTSAALSGQGSIPSNMVTNTNDSGPGSLRLALENATAGTVLVFTTGSNPTFVLSSGHITISHPVAADLSALGTVTIDGGGATAILLNCGALGMQLRGVRIINTPPGLGVRSLCPSVRGAVIQKP